MRKLDKEVNCSLVATEVSNDSLGSSTAGMSADESHGAGLCTTTWTNHCMQVTFEKGGRALHGQLSLTESNTREAPKCEWSTASTAATSAYPTCTKCTFVTINVSYM